MKVLIITNIPSPYRVRFYNEIGKVINLYVLYERHSASDRDKNWSSGDAKKYKSIFMHGISIGNESSFGWEAIKQINKIKPDIIVISGYSSPAVILTILYCQLNRLKYIISMDGAILKDESRLKYLFKKFIIGRAQAGLCTGRLSKDYLRHYGIEQKNIYTYPFTSQNDSDLEKAASMCGDKDYYRNKLGIIEKKTIISVGRFSYNSGYGKGYDILIEAVKNINKEIGIYIVGEEPTSEFIQIKNQYRLNNLHFIGFKIKDELAEYYAAADVFVLLTRYDIWGLVINEAMSFGLPVITTDMCVAGMELIENGVNGYIVPSENAEAAYDAIVTLMGNDEVMRAMKDNNLKKIKNYSIEKMAAAHYEIFSAITKENHE